MEFYQSEPIIAGRYFTANDYYPAIRYAWCRSRRAKKLFGTTDVIGLTIEVTPVRNHTGSENR